MDCWPVPVLTRPKPIIFLTATLIALGRLGEGEKAAPSRYRSSKTKFLHESDC